MASLYPLDEDSVDKAAFLNALQVYRKDKPKLEKMKIRYGG
jgi:hypothetical protein